MIVRAAVRSSFVPRPHDPDFLSGFRRSSYLLHWRAREFRGCSFVCSSEQANPICVVLASHPQRFLSEISLMDQELKDFAVAVAQQISLVPMHNFLTKTAVAHRESRDRRGVSFQCCRSIPPRLRAPRRKSSQRNWQWLRGPGNCVFQGGRLIL